MANIKELLAKSKQNVSGVLKTSNGINENGIYKNSIFEGMNENEIKHYRSRIRKYVFNIFETICTTNEAKDTKNVEILCKEFVSFYKETYKVNDFSFASVASENTKDTKKDVIKNALEIVKKYANKKA